MLRGLALVAYPVYAVLLNLSDVLKQYLLYIGQCLVTFLRIESAIDWQGGYNELLEREVLLYGYSSSPVVGLWDRISKNFSSDEREV